MRLGLCVLLAALSGCHPRPGTAGPDPEKAALVLPADHVGPTAVAPGLASGGGRGQDDGFGCGLPLDLRTRGWPQMLPNLRAGQPPAPEPGGVTLVVLPDTQYYAGCRSRYLKDQVDFVLAQLEARNIALVLTVGDLTDHNDAAEWRFFHEAVEPLFERVPLILTTGNHDHGQGGAAHTRGSGLLRAFAQPPARGRALLAAMPADGNWENAYYRLPLGRSMLGILTLEWSPRRDVVSWAARELDRFPTDRLVFSTHAYLYHDDSRYDWERFGDAQEWSPRAYGTARLDPAREAGPDNWTPDGAYDGEMLWQDLLRKRTGLWLTLNGHVLGDGEGYLASRGDQGNLVHQMLVNFQMLKEGGSGFLRLLQIDPRGRTLRVWTYSPTLDQTATGPRQEFELTLDSATRPVKSVKGPRPDERAKRARGPGACSG